MVGCSSSIFPLYVLMFYFVLTLTTPPLILFPPNFIPIVTEPSKCILQDFIVTHPLWGELWCLDLKRQNKRPWENAPHSPCSRVLVCSIPFLLWYDSVICLGAQNSTVWWRNHVISLSTGWDMWDGGLGGLSLGCIASHNSVQHCCTSPSPTPNHTYLLCSFTRLHDSFTGESHFWLSRRLCSLVI